MTRVNLTTEDRAILTEIDPDIKQVLAGHRWLISGNFRAGTEASLILTRWPAKDPRGTYTLGHDGRITFGGASLLGLDCDWTLAPITVPSDQLVILKGIEAFELDEKRKQHLAARPARNLRLDDPRQLSLFPGLGIHVR